MAKKKIIKSIVGFAKGILMAKTSAKAPVKAKKPAPAKAKKAAVAAPKKPDKSAAKAKAAKPAAAKPVSAAKSVGAKEIKTPPDKKPAPPITKVAPMVPQQAKAEPKKPEPMPTKAAAVAKSSPAVIHDDDDREPTGRAGARSPMRSEDLFTDAEISVFRNLLTTERKKILQKARQAMESGNIHLDKDEMYDEVDLASATVEQNLTFRLLDRDRKLLGEIDHAIAKLENGDYGFCEGTGEPIPKRRLELRPWCRHSVKYKEQLERMEKSGRGVADEDEL